jgi:hypothetical protein
MQRHASVWSSLGAAVVFALGIGVIGSGTASANPPASRQARRWSSTSISSVARGPGLHGRVGQRKPHLRESRRQAGEAPHRRRRQLEDHRLRLDRQQHRHASERRPRHLPRLCAHSREDRRSSEDLRRHRGRSHHPGVPLRTRTFELNRTEASRSSRSCPTPCSMPASRTIVWTIDTNSDFRIVQFRVYRAQ